LEPFKAGSWYLKRGCLRQVPAKRPEKPDRPGGRDRYSNFEGATPRPRKSFLIEDQPTDKIDSINSIKHDILFYEWKRNAPIIRE
jgi:hypothetical protein